MKKEITKPKIQKTEKKSEEKTNEKVSKHPKYYEHAKVICSCGNTFEVGSTMPEIRVEICSACHPLYTGKNKFIDAAGRVDKFQERVRKAKEIKEAKAKKNKPKVDIKPKNKKAK
jgi:large subunit ribosomal protein L31